MFWSISFCLLNLVISILQFQACQFNTIHFANDTLYEKNTKDTNITAYQYNLKTQLLKTIPYITINNSIIIEKEFKINYFKFA